MPGIFARLFGRGEEGSSGRPTPRRRGGRGRPPPRDTPLVRLARRIQVPPPRLAWVLFHEREPYRVITRPKASGGTRTIHAPSAARKHLQRQALRRLLAPHDTSPPSHGFRRHRSTFTGARYHLRKPLVVKLDLEDFFPSVTAPRVAGVLRSMGLERPQVYLLTRLCTHQGRLPQGAPTSPVLANLVCRRLDRRLLGLARREGFAYTRYADDLTFSGPRRMRRCLPLIRRIIQEEGFRLHPGKTRLMRYGARQEVTGLTVNRRVTVPRLRRRWVRAIVHNATRTGLAAQNRTGHADLRAFLVGNARYIARTHPREGARLLARIAELRP